MAIGITSYGAYIPPTRLAYATIGGRPAKDGGAEKAVAWNDEDSLTMGVAAALHCLRDFEREAVDAVLFASTTHVFEEKQGAALIARALDLRRDVQTADHAGSLRAGTAALRSAFDAVTAGSARSVLVIASDCRMAAPSSPLEMNVGDGAAAFLVADGRAIASLEAHHAVANELVDLWRNKGDTFVHTWEDRFVVQEGYTPNLSEGVQGLLEKTGTKIGDYAKVAFVGTDKRSHGTAARAIGASADQTVDPLFGRMGHAGAAFAPLLLISALENAKPGERILLANYGDGADALAFATHDAIEKLEPRRGVAWHLGRRRGVASYDKYLKARGLGASEWEKGGDPGLSATIHFRERDDDLSFRAQKCNACSALQFPAQRVCESCFAKDDFSTVRMSDRLGRVLTYTFDFFFPTPDPPTVVTITDVDGARVHLQLVNVKPDDVAIGMPVEFVFRRIHKAGGRPNYYWKGTPVPAEEA